MPTRTKTRRNREEAHVWIRRAKPRWRWYHGIAFYGLMQVLAFGLAGLVSAARKNEVKNMKEAMVGDVSYFRSLKQAKITPPSWAFGPAWTINNISVIWGMLRVLNRPEGTPGREDYLVLQAGSWLIYVLFNAAYFGLRSPVNALILSITMLLFTIASSLVALFKLKDSQVALSLATLFLWLLIATTAAAAQAAWNHDDFYGFGPLSEADPRFAAT